MSKNKVSYVISYLRINFRQNIAELAYEKLLIISNDKIACVFAATPYGLNPLDHIYKSFDISSLFLGHFLSVKYC